MARVGLPVLLFMAATLPILFPLPSHADVTLEYAIETRLPAAESSTSTMWLTDGKLAVKSTGDKPTRVIYWAKDDRLAVIDDAKKSYFEMTGDEMREMAKTIGDLSGQVSAAMATLSPEQKAMIESEMAKMGVQKAGASDQSAAIEVLLLSETRVIGGFKCQRHDVLRGGAKCAEAWSTPVADSTATAAEMKSLAGMANLINLLIESVTPMTKAMGMELPLPTGLAQGLDGIPVYIKDLNGDATKSEMTLQSLNRGTINTSVFEIGDKYKKQELSMER